MKLNIERIYDLAPVIKRVNWNPEIIDKVANNYKNLIESDGTKDCKSVINYVLEEVLKMYVSHMKFLGEAVRVQIWNASGEEDYEKRKQEIVVWAISVARDLTARLEPLNMDSEIEKLKIRCLKDFRIS